MLSTQYKWRVPTMIKISWVWVLSLVLMACVGQTHHMPSAWQTATINAHQRVVHSIHTHKDYVVQVAVVGDEPKDGYPVLYVLDGNAFFATAHTMTQMRHHHPSQTVKHALMIVGIGYVGDKPFDIAGRTHDYTLPSERYPTPQGEQVRFGGSDAFLAFIEQELKPMLYDKWHINHHRQSIFGHSYGGLFVLHTLLTKPKSFNGYLIASPSLWWNDGRVMSDFPNYAGQSANIHRIWLSVGELESGSQNPMRQASQSTSHVMSTKQVYEFLQQHTPNALVAFKQNPDQNHGSNAYVSLMQAVNLTYQNPPN